MSIFIIICALVLLTNFLLYNAVSMFYPISNPEWENDLSKYLSMVPSTIMWLIYLFSPILVIFYPELLTELADLQPLMQNNLFFYSRLLGLVLVSIGTSIVYLGRRALNQTRSMGFANSGIYSFIRHPIYLAYGIYIISFILIFPSILTLSLGIGIIGFYITATYEEKKMLLNYGQIFETYTHTTKKFIPKIF